MTRGNDTLVSVGLPVRNGERYVERALRSVLAQDHERVELVISDNASDDATEEICRQYARSDERIRYHRLAKNIGLVNNFIRVLDLAGGAYFRWLGADDWLGAPYASRCLEVFAEDPRLILVTTQQVYVDDHGGALTDPYTGDRLRSDRPAERFAEMLRLLNESHLLIDPLYSLMRREPVARITRLNMLYEDEILAAKLALAGPFGHAPKILAYRRFQPFQRQREYADKLGVSTWHCWVRTASMCRELAGYVRNAPLSQQERRQALASLGAWYCRRHCRTAVRRSRKVGALVTRAWRPAGST